MSLWVVFAYDQYFFGPYFVTESFTPRHSFLYCLPLFVLGGIIYLYRGDIRGFCGRKRPLALVLRLTGTVLWFALPHGGSTVFYLESLVAMVLWLAYAIGVDSRFLSCRPARGSPAYPWSSTWRRWSCSEWYSGWDCCTCSARAASAGGQATLWRLRRRWRAGSVR